jgi:hypothetical protein
VEALAREHGVPVQRVGAVGAVHGEFRIALRDAAIDTIREPIDRLREVYCNAIPRRMGD